MDETESLQTTHEVEGPGEETIQVTIFVFWDHDEERWIGEGRAKVGTRSHTCWNKGSTKESVRFRILHEIVETSFQLQWLPG